MESPKREQCPPWQKTRQDGSVDSISYCNYGVQDYGAPVRIVLSTWKSTARIAIVSTILVGLVSASTPTASAGWLSDLLAAWFGSSSGSESGNLVNGGAPVPTISADSASVAFLKQQVMDQAVADGSDANEVDESCEAYATKLAQVLGQLSAEEQRVVFYGR